MAIRIVFAPTIEEPETLIVLSAKLRLYAGLSHGGSYYHLIRPLRDEDYRVRHEGGRIGALACNCVGFATHGHCYMATAAIAFEGEQAGDPLPAPFRTIVMGLDNPAGAGESVEAARG